MDTSTLTLSAPHHAQVATFVMIHQLSAGESLTNIILAHHANSSGVYQICRIGMMHKCSPGELFTRVAFMYNNDKCHSARRHCPSGLIYCIL